MLWALFAVDLEGEVRQTPFSALLPLCGIRHLSPGLSFPSGKAGAPKNKWGKSQGSGSKSQPGPLWKRAQLAALRPPVQNTAGCKGTYFSKDGCGGARLKAWIVLRAQGRYLFAQKQTGSGCKQMDTGSKAWRPRPAPGMDVKVWTLQEGDHGI